MISMAEGTDLTAPLQFKDLSGTVIDLTGATSVIGSVFQEPREGATIALQMTVAGSKVSLTDAVNGKLDLVFADGDLDAGEYTVEVTATLASGDVVFLGREAIFVWSSNAL